MDTEAIVALREECLDHLENELLPFWLNRCLDQNNGGFITHFDKDGRDTGEDEKSLIAQTRSIYTMSSSHRAGYGSGTCADFARHGIDFLLDKMWDSEHGGFFWAVDRTGTVTDDKKIVYGQSFAIYALSEYTLATGDSRGIEYAEQTFDLLQRRCSDVEHGGYYEMFERNWQLRGPGSQGGDRKTLDVHMHLMEAFTTLYECSRKDTHRRALLGIIDVLETRILHPRFATGIPQFTADWKVAPQIQFDTVWGLDRFELGGSKANAEDNTSAGHNLEFAWLLLHALDVLALGMGQHSDIVFKQLNHALQNGIDREYGGVYVEGPHGGGVTDHQKEFWQQAEAMIALLEACLRFGPENYWSAYENVHRFVFDKCINHPVGEWWPLLTREGEPIWTHMSNSWKLSYHTVRSMVQCVKRLDQLLGQD